MSEGDSSFEIGFVLSGTISAGSYTAGVLDFFIEALNEWSNSPKIDFDYILPRPNVTIKAISGNSGGALNAFLFACSLFQPQFKPYSSDEEPSLFDNPLYASWVNGVTLDQLLSLGDLEHTPHVTSLLNSQPIYHLIHHIVNTLPEHPLMPSPMWISTDLELILTYAYLDGVPYALPMSTQDHLLWQFSDYQHFILSSTNPQTQPFFPQHWRRPPLWLHPSAPQFHDTLLQLVDSALASSAFPIGLAPYSLAIEPHTLILPAKKPIQAYEAWMKQHSLLSERFLTVDGGVVNNNPIELARTALSRDPDTRNPREADRAQKALIMISPLHSTRLPQKITESPSIIRLLPAILRLLLEQSRFKWDELRLAWDSDIYSRFLIVPHYRSETVDIGPSLPLYGQLLAGFGGFLHPAFRRHDYLLGRRNAQQFLRHHFVLPESNAHFAHWTNQQKAMFALPEERPYQHSDGRQHREQFLPIIPLVNQAAKTIPLPGRPSIYSLVSISTVLTALDKRIGLILDRLSQALPLSWVVKLMLKPILNVGVKQPLQRWFTQWIQHEFAQFQT